jgi:hypothetical protein
MGRASGEQARRTVLRGAKAHQRYDELMLIRDRQRLAKALRDVANRVEAGTKTAKAQRAAGTYIAGTLAVTDHAVVRFLERIMGLDIAAVRREIARAIPASAVPDGERGEHSIHVRDGFQFLLTATSVISVLTAEMDGQGWLEREDLDVLGNA